MKSEKGDTILVVDDDITLCQLVASYLVDNGFQVAVCHSGREAVQLIVSTQPRLVILDLMLPEIDGLSVCREARPEYKGVILMMTALDDVSDQITGLEVGADDYVTKPVTPRLLLARIRALLRRTHTPKTNPSERIVIDGLIIDHANREVWLGDKQISCTTTEFDMLWMLAEKAGTIISRDDIYQHLYRLLPSIDDRRVDLMVSRLRSKLGDSPSQPRYIKTIRGKGYLLGKGH